jgi:hypothetical protein
VTAVAEFSVRALSVTEAEDAIEALEAILELEGLGEIDLPPGLARLLLQLEDVLAAFASNSAEQTGMAPAAAVVPAGSSRPSSRVHAVRKAAVGA